MTSAARTPLLERNPRARWLLPLFLVVLAGLSWQRLVRSAEPPQLALAGQAMGTTWSLRLGSEPDVALDELARLVQERLDQVDRAMSTYKADSELSRFNRHASLEPFAVSSATLEVFRVATEVSERSGGALDVTVGPLVALWGFGAGAKIPGAPPPEELERVLERVGWRRIELDESAGTLTKTHPETICDLSAVAKGYAVDRAAEALVERGVADFLFELGGELSARGQRPEGGPWRVGIEDANESGRDVLEVVHLGDEALATSGDYRNYYEEDGVRRSHLLDPRTGRPIEHGLASVSVIHARAAQADAWATALAVLGHEEGRRIAEEEGLAVHFVLRQPDGSFASRSTASFADRLRGTP
jgi:thiamine biosynthesis lipoprotein